MVKLSKLLYKIKKNKRVVLLSILFIIFYIGIFFVFRNSGVSKEEIQKIIEPYGVNGLLVMLALQIVFSLTPMPDSAMPLLAMIMYGPLGVVVIMFGMLIASVIHYFLAKIVGKAFIVKKFPEVEKYLNKIGSKDVIIRLVALRIFTFVSFDITSYIAGISGIPFKKFMIGTVLGLIPTNLILILVGFGLFAKSKSDIVVTWGLIIFIAIILLIFYKKFKIK